MSRIELLLLIIFFPVKIHSKLAGFKKVKWIPEMIFQECDIKF